MSHASRHAACVAHALLEAYRAHQRVMCLMSPLHAAHAYMCLHLSIYTSALTTYTSIYICVYVYTRICGGQELHLWSEAEQLYIFGLTFK